MKTSFVVLLILLTKCDDFDTILILFVSISRFFLLPNKHLLNLRKFDNFFVDKMALFFLLFCYLIRYVAGFVQIY